MVISCEDKTSNSNDSLIIPDDSFRYFKFSTFPNDGEAPHFIARTSNSELLTRIDIELSKPKTERFKHVNGNIIEGNGGYNFDWSWRFKDDQWNIVDASIEVCDGNPNYIEDHLEYFIDTLNGHYCPWGSKLENEMFSGDIVE